MGGILTSAANDSIYGAEYGYACNTDSDCWNYVYPANAVPGTATTTAEKAKRCCMRTKTNTVNNWPLANLNATQFGWSKVAG